MTDLKHHASNKDNCSKCMDLWIKRENEIAKYQTFVKEWDSTHSLSRAPSFTSWKTNYKK